MRFCPFCSAENEDAATECAACARRLPPLPPRRRKAGSEPTEVAPERNDIAREPTELVPVMVDGGATADVSNSSEKAKEQTPVQTLLGPKTKSVADITVSPAAGRSQAAPSEVAPPGMVDRRKPTAIPSPRGRRRTMPPIPSRTERDRLASMSTGVAPGLASESIPLPKKKPKETETSEDGWPAPARNPAPHPDDWNLEQEPEAASVMSSDDPARLAEPTAATARVVTPAPADVVQSKAATSSEAPSAATDPTAPVTVPPANDWTESPAVVQMIKPAAVSQPFKAADVAPVPPVPEAGLIAAVKYTIAFTRARWQRRGAIGDLREQITKDTGILDEILGTLGRHTRSLGLENKSLEAENKAIDSAEDRRRAAEHACSELSNRQAEENSKFAELEADRQSKVAEADRALDVAQTELGALEAQRRDLREQRKTIENRQKGYLKAADSRDADSDKQESRDKREELRAAASALRKDAELLVQERQDIERRYDALEQPLSQLSSRVDALKSDRDAAKRSLTDLREGHRHRLAEIDAEQGRKSRELAQAEAEIERRFVTLGTLVNLNRIEREEFVGIYEQIDTLRGAIGARSNEIDKLSAERQAFDKASLIRGAVVIGGSVLLFLAFLAIVLAAT